MVINFILHSTVQNTTENIEHLKHIHAHSIIHFLFCVDLTEASVWYCMLPSLSLVPRPLPPDKRPGTHCLCICEISCYIFFCALTMSVCGDYTNQKYGELIP